MSSTLLQRYELQSIKAQHNLSPPPEPAFNELIRLDSCHSPTIEYRAEGAANVIWTISTPPNQVMAIKARDRVPFWILRTRKDLGPARLQSTLENAQAVSHIIHTLIPARWLLAPYLYPIPRHTLQTMNLLLQALEATGDRPEKRRGVLLPTIDTEPFGLLLPDLSRSSHPTSCLLEFKPKWLVQSAMAPSTATRCRNCALKAMRTSLDVEPGKGTSDFCPLDLLSDDLAVLAEAVSRIYQPATKRFGLASTLLTPVALVRMFVKEVQPLLKSLHQLQIEYPVILPFPTPSDREKLSTAMTLRDVSVFVRLARDATSDQVSIEDVKLGDLDLKVATEENLNKWEVLDCALVQGDWYTGKGLLSHFCAIERRGHSR